MPCNYFVSLLCGVTHVSCSSHHLSFAGSWSSLPLSFVWPCWLHVMKPVRQPSVMCRPGAQHPQVLPAGCTLKPEVLYDHRVSILLDAALTLPWNFLSQQHVLNNTNHIDVVCKLKCICMSRTHVTWPLWPLFLGSLCSFNAQSLRLHAHATNAKMPVRSIHGQKYVVCWIYRVCQVRKCMRRWITLIITFTYLSKSIWSKSVTESKLTSIHTNFNLIMVCALFFLKFRKTWVWSKF